MAPEPNTVIITKNSELMSYREQNIVVRSMENEHEFLREKWENIPVLVIQSNQTGNQRITVLKNMYATSKEMDSLMPAMPLVIELIR